MYHTAVPPPQGVRDITFSNDGRRFVSTGYDKNVRVWDTETGKVVQTFNTGKVRAGFLWRHPASCLL